MLHGIVTVKEEPCMCVLSITSSPCIRSSSILTMTRSRPS